MDLLVCVGRREDQLRNRVEAARLKKEAQSLAQPPQQQRIASSGPQRSQICQQHVVPIERSLTIVATGPAQLVDLRHEVGGVRPAQRLGAQELDLNREHRTLHDRVLTCT